MVPKARGRHGPFRPRSLEGLEDVGGTAGSRTGTQVGGQEDLLGDAGAMLGSSEKMVDLTMEDRMIYSLRMFKNCLT